MLNTKADTTKTGSLLFVAYCLAQVLDENFRIVPAKIMLVFMV